MAESTSAAEPSTEGRLRAWFAVGIFVLAYAVSMLDRQVVNLLAEPLKRDLALSDTEIGVLLGPAFGVFYAVLGLPLGWLADRMNRVVLAALGILLWSGMTGASGLVHDFDGLLLTRLGVGVGEAALVPAAVSLLAELFAPGRRALPLSVFTCGISIGAGLALILGGSFIAWSQHGIAALPLVGDWFASRRSWQTVFILCGLLGLPVAALVLLLRDPRSRRRHAGTARSDDSGSAGAALRHLLRERAFFVPMLLALSGLYLVTNASSAWIPTLFIRRFGWTPAAVGQSVGIVIALCALAGNVSSGLLTGLLGRRGYPDATLRTMLTGTGLMLPAAISTPLLAGADGTLFGVMALYFSFALTFGVATTAFVEVTPPPLRGQIIALYLLLGNLVGLGLGPPSVGRVIDHGVAPFDSIGPALALVCGIAALPSIALLAWARSAFQRIVSGHGRREIPLC